MHKKLITIIRIITIKQYELITINATNLWSVLNLWKILSGIDN